MRIERAGGEVYLTLTSSCALLSDQLIEYNLSLPNQRQRIGDLFLMSLFKDQYGLNLTYRFTILTTAAPDFPAGKGIAVVRDFDDEWRCGTRCIRRQRRRTSRRLGQRAWFFSRGQEWPSKCYFHQGEITLTNTFSCSRE